MERTKKIAIIGAGRMGEAMISRAHSQPKSRSEVLPVIVGKT